MPFGAAIFRLLTKLLAWILPEIGLEARLASLSGTDFMTAAGSPTIRMTKIAGITIFSLFSYKNELARETIWLLKYRGSRQAARIFGQCLHKSIIRILAKDALATLLLVPLPMSLERRKERGWNQTEMIAQEIIVEEIMVNKTLSGNPVLTLIAPGIFIKNRHTPPQTRLSRADRLKNLSGCFSVTEQSAVKGREIILIDDVLTTGATIAEAVTVLRCVGAGNIMAFTVAS